jgi:DNA-binding GntR family transcriptional regulator|tara:strand:+ start:5213 stop:5857 length:645 start_codon:yes stop_codon:yes gene_type:complete
MAKPPLSQTHQAYLFLEEQLVTLELKPGSVVTEKQLIERVGLGRTPVREAIQRFQTDGLIEVRPRSGIKIADIRAEDYRLIMEPRTVLEPLLARSVALYADENSQTALADCAERMLSRAREKDTKGFLVADKAFDEILRDACPNRFISSALAPLQTHARRFWFRFGAKDGPEESAEHHVKVMRAIERQDRQAAEESMRNLMDYLSGIARGATAF